jgi:hypothetical protein
MKKLKSTDEKREQIIYEGNIEQSQAAAERHREKGRAQQLDDDELIEILDCILD